MKKIPQLLLALALTLNASSMAGAIIADNVEEPLEFDELAQNLAPFQKYLTVEPQELKVPTVVEVTVAASIDYAVLKDHEEGQFEPYWVYNEHVESMPPLLTEETALIDGDSSTYVEYAVPDKEQGSVDITLKTNAPISAHTLTVLLDAYTALPKKVEVRATVNGEEKILLASSSMTSHSVDFPETRSDTWRIRFDYAQPLRIAELSLYPGSTGATDPIRKLRFLAQPGSTYEIYFDADRPASIQTAEAGDLTNNKGVQPIQGSEAQENSYYRPGDYDEDGILDEVDNCVQMANPDQTDLDENGRGDLCDDFDRDGILNGEDNCENDPNKYQEDEDSDGIGDVCDKEESRFTEKYPFVPWLGMGLAFGIILGLFFKTLRRR